MPELQPGDPRRLGSYEVLERLGEGGQGVVYLGVDANGSQAAIKLLRADLAGDASARNRFVREAQAAKQVARFCTAQVLEADVAGDRPYIASEYVQGPSLHKQITEQGPLVGAALERLAIGTATALVAIHQAGIVHRDFKPHNVIMAPDGPRVIDFGIARALDTGQTAATKAIGTPSYMAPEQVAGERLTEAVDVWAWAATMVYAATGRPPFGDDTVVAVINRVMHEPPTLAGVPEDLHPLLAACLVKEPHRRPTAQQIMMTMIGSGPAAQTRMEDAAQATSMLAAGETMAAGIAPLPHADPAGGTRRVTPAEFTGTLPPAPGYETQPAGYGGGRGATRGGGYVDRGYDDRYAPERKSRWPIFAAVAAIAVLALVVGLAMAATNDRPGNTEDPSPSDSTSSQRETRTEETRDPVVPQSPRTTRSTTPRETRTIPTRTPTTRPTQPTTTEQPPTSEDPTDTGPPTGGGNNGGGGDNGGGGNGGQNDGNVRDNSADGS
ncbi:hypothetical protein GCM10009678_50210 [Actinomadura kijaniata]|uniref:Putative Ser/Thr protein kinase n=1 Tax=Actinomadura namibiensis TaxID=182080 RepID=A0A7W3LI89_ACTNM|nr:serine/threonine-protein kinase [Actinomadura namibiensis]MBA8948606.1 putative Ser/Thr protein kinase [Actinomadura namibiensis]